MAIVPAPPRLSLGLLALFGLLLALGCTRDCPTCSGTRRVSVTRDCERCSGTGMVRVPCERCGGQGILVKGGLCPYCEGTGKSKCRYSFPASGREMGIAPTWVDERCVYPTYAIVCKGGRLEGADPSSEAAYANTKPSRVCPSCLGTGQNICSACQGSGRQSADARCSACLGQGTHLSRCPECEGERRLSHQEPCPRCLGTGRVSRFS